MYITRCSWLIRLSSILLSALDKLLSVKTTVYRAVRLEELHECGMHQGEKIVVWQDFSSCSTSETISAREQLVLGQIDRRYLFAIDCVTGKDIQMHSYFKQEKEKSCCY